MVITVFIVVGVVAVAVAVGVGGGPTFTVSLREDRRGERPGARERLN